jgi:SNF family Na+-dependent transporter
MTRRMIFYVLVTIAALSSELSIIAVAALKYILMMGQQKSKTVPCTHIYMS